MGTVKVKRFVGVYMLKSRRRRYEGRQDVCFYIMYKVDGKLRKEKVGWLSEGYSAKIAAEIRAERLKDARHGQTVKTAAELRREKNQSNKTLKEIKDYYFESERGKALKGRRTDLNRWEKHLVCIENKRVSELTQFDIESIKKSMHGRKIATISNTLELLRRILNYGKKFNLCPALSFTIELPAKNNEVTEYLTPEQAARLQQVLDEWPRQDIARMVKLAWLTGMRRGEIFKLKVEHIDFQQNIITIVDAKSGRDETIPLGPLVSELLHEQIKWLRQHYPSSPFLFPGKNGNKRVACSAVKRIKKAAGLPDSFRPFHGLRHHMAVTLASSGEYTLDMIAELLTHKDTKITRRYAAFLPDAKKKAAIRAEELLSNQIIQK